MRWKFLIGVALSALFLWLAFRNARVGEVLRVLASVRFWFILPTLLFTMAAFLVRAWRWKYLLEGVRVIPLPALFSSTMIGFMGNNILPARLGELMRAHSLGQSTGVSRSAALASIVVERIFDIFVLLVMLGIILLLRPLKREIQVWGAILLAASLPVLVLLFLYRRYPEPVIRLVARLTPARYGSKVSKMAENFREGLSIFHRGGSMLWALFWSLVMWGCLIIVISLCMKALRLELPIDAGLVVLVVMAIGTMIPSAPGYIGTMQYAGTVALLQYGVDRPEALSFTILYHASQWIPVTVVGLIYFMRQNLGLRRWAGYAGSGTPPEVPLEE